MAKNSRKPSGVVIPVARYSMVVEHTHGRAVTIVRGNDSLHSWTRRTTRRIKGEVVGPGITVRPDSVTIRFEGDAKVVSDNR